MLHTHHTRDVEFFQTSWKPPLSYVLQTQSYKIPLWKPAPRDVSIYIYLLISQCRDLIINAIDSSVIIAAALYGFRLTIFLCRSIFIAYIATHRGVGATSYVIRTSDRCGDFDGNASKRAVRHESAITHARSGIGDYYIASVHQTWESLQKYFGVESVRCGCGEENSRKCKLFVLKERAPRSLPLAPV